MPATAAHARCHSCSLHRRAPTELQAACACAWVTLVHGCTPAREHTVLPAAPEDAALASGRDAS